jgi:hypothetical protein
MGFSPNSPKPSILVYKKKNHYNEWEFVYDPLAEQMLQQGGVAGGGSNGLTRQAERPRQDARSASAAQPSVAGSSFGGGSSTGGAGRYTLNEEPQPQVDFTWGFSNLKPAASSVST